MGMAHRKVKCLNEYLASKAKDILVSFGWQRNEQEILNGGM